MKKVFVPVVILLASLLFSCSTGKKESPSPRVMAGKIRECLEKHEIDSWYPRSIDSVNGGYIQRFSYDWKADSVQDKYIVYQTRQVWTTSLLYEFMPERKEFLAYAQHGFRFMRDKMWDKEFGGFFMNLDGQGNPDPRFVGEKRVYGQAFAVYALSQYYLASGDPEALDLVKREFQWLENGSHDPENGGYWEFLYRNGKPIAEDDTASSSLMDIRLKGFKDFNSSIHILEALSTLYRAWPDPLVKARLTEMLNIIKNTMIDSKGYLVQYFHGDWRRASGGEMKARTGSDRWQGEPITFGHDIETAYLLIEAAESLGWDESVVMPTAKKLTEHTLKFGWDHVNGGIFNDGNHITPDSVVITDNHKSWWAGVEALNTFLLMSQKVPAERKKYYDLFVKQWDYIDQFLIDHTYGEFYSNGLDTHPENKNMPKAHGWKAPYHITRALVNCLRMLETEELKESQ